MKISNLKEKSQALVAEVIQTGVHAILKRDHDNIPDVLNFALNSALTCIIPVTPFVSKRPTLSEKDAEKRGPRELEKLLTFETVLFCSLLTARMHGGIEITDRMESSPFSGASCVVANGKVNFGPEVFEQALEDWKKVTGKDPLDFLDHNLLKAIEEAAADKDALAPFEKLLESRKATSKTLN